MEEISPENEVNDLDLNEDEDANFPFIIKKEFHNKGKVSKFDFIEALYNFKSKK